MKKNGRPLDPVEAQALKNCERTFRRSDRTPFRAGRVLQVIRDNELYREAFPSFAAYCKRRLDCSRSRADRYIGAWRVDQLLTPIGVTLRHESQARPLIALTDDQGVAVGKHNINLSIPFGFEFEPDAGLIPEGLHGYSRVLARSEVKRHKPPGSAVLTVRQTLDRMLDQTLLMPRPGVKEMEAGLVRCLARRLTDQT